MLQIDPIELANRLQRPGGTDWVAFMDNLLGAAARKLAFLRVPFVQIFALTAKTAVWIHG